MGTRQLVVQPLKLHIGLCVSPIKRGDILLTVLAACIMSDTRTACHHCTIGVCELVPWLSIITGY